MTDLVVRPLEASDRPRWAELFEEYREFCGRSVNTEIVDRVWEWLQNSAHPVRCLVIAPADGGDIAGIAHLRSFHRTVDANEGLHLDDLYVASEYRGNGAARTLLEGVGALADLEEAEFVRWVTADDNVDAQRLYDGIAERTAWVTYERRPVPVEEAETVVTIPE